MLSCWCFPPTPACLRTRALSETPAHPPTPSPVPCLLPTLLLPPVVCYVCGLQSDAVHQPLLRQKAPAANNAGTVGACVVYFLVDVKREGMSLRRQQ